MTDQDVLRRVLDRMRWEDLSELARARGASPRGKKVELIDRIARDADLHEVVRLYRDSFWTLSEWNDFVADDLGGRRTRSWDDLHDELALCIDEQRDLVWKLMECTTSEIKEAAADSAQCAAALGLTPDTFMEILTTYNGNTLLRNLWTDLVEDAGKVRHREETRRMALAAVRRREQPQALRRTPTLPPPPPVHDIAAAPRPALSRAVPAPAPENSPSEGHVLLGGYRVGRELGRGGFGVTYEVTHVRSGTKYAAKFPLHSEAVAGLRREFDKASGLRSKHICIYHPTDPDPIFGEFLLTEHGGASLEKWCGNAPLAFTTVAHILRQAAAALDEAHKSHVVHGDVSPGNILIDDRQHVRLTDFGVAKTLGEKALTSRYTRVAANPGAYNPFYASPEVRQGDYMRPVSDQYSLATTAVALIHGVNEYEQLSFHERQAVASRLPRGVRSVIEVALSAETSRRHRTCTDFADAFARATVG
ncbi:MAG: protein kinase [Myxococcota bacterium]|nr:protein kinase [Myxococcota bacterium]